MKKYVLLGFLVLFVVAGVFAQTITKIEQGRSSGSFVITASNGNNAYVGGGNWTLAAWSGEVAVFRAGNTLITYDARGNKLGEQSNPDFGRATITVSGSTITVRGSTTATYNSRLNLTSGGRS